MNTERIFNSNTIEKLFIDEYVKKGVKRLWEDNASNFIQKLREIKKNLTKDAEIAVKDASDSGTLLVDVSVTFNIPSTAPVYEVINRIVSEDGFLLCVSRGWSEVCVKSTNCPAYKSAISKRFKEIFKLITKVSSEIRKQGFVSDSDDIKMLVQFVSSFISHGTMYDTPIGKEGNECKDTKYEPYSYYNLEIHKP